MSFENINISDKTFYFSDNVWWYYPMQIYQSAVTFILFHLKVLQKLVQTTHTTKKRENRNFCKFTFGQLFQRKKGNTISFRCLRFICNRCFFFLIHIVLQSCLWCLHLFICKIKKKIRYFQTQFVLYFELLEF